MRPQAGPLQANQPCETLNKTAARQSHLASSSKQTETSSSSCCNGRQNATKWLLLVAATCCVAAQSSQQQQYHQHNNILHFVVPEGAPNNTYLGNIRSADGQTPSFVLPTALTPENERLAALSVNLSNGDLVTCGQLDREHREQYTFIAIVSSPFAEIKCTVTVRDINDNAPMFVMPPNENNFVIEIPEGQRGVRRPLPMAVDLDSLQFGVQEFRFTSNNTPIGMFKLVEHEAPASPINVAVNDDAVSTILAPDNPQLQQQFAQQASVLIPSQPVMSPAGISTSGSPTQQRYFIDLEVNPSLDRENQSSYQLVLEAVDKGQPPLHGRLIVTVNVQDINDNDPVFTRKFYECQIREDTLKGATLIRVQAHDVDLDLNGQISYTIKRHSSSSQTNQQQINSNSSDTTNTIDLNSSSSGSSSSSSSSNSNNRYATNNNNNNNNNNGKRPSMIAAPINSKLTPRQQGSNEIYETSEPSNSNTANINIFKNSKLPPNNNHNVGSSPQEQLFEIDALKGEIYLAQQLDYETDQWHELLVEARDHGKPSRSAYATVKILVVDINDDPLITPSNYLEGSKKALPQPQPSEASKFNRSDGFMELLHNSFQIPILSGWFAQFNYLSFFIVFLVTITVVACLVFVLKPRGHQLESDYNDTAGLTLTSNNGQAKQSPNHSTNDEHQNGSADNHHRHHDHQRRSINGSFGGHNGLGNGFGLPSGKLPSRYHCTDSSNLYHNPHSHQPSRHTSNHLQPSESLSGHQVVNSAVGLGGGGSAGGTMTLHNNHSLLGSPGGPNSLEHHPFLNVTNAHHSSSLTYAHHHSRAALLHQAHHHQSSHHLSSIHHGHNNKGGTMNSVGTHHSAHPSASPLPATPNTTHSSGLPPNLNDTQHGLGHSSLLPRPPSAQQSQLPPTPCNAISNAFPWPQEPGSPMSCFPPCTGGGPMHNGGTLDSVPNSQPPDCWFDLSVSSQLAQDWYSSYDWDYLSDWAPDYHKLMPLIQADACTY